MADAYRDVTFQGGAVDSGFIPLWLGLVDRPVRPAAVLARAPTRRKPRPIYLEHLLGNAEFAAQKMLGATLGEEAAYDGPFYRLRSPVVRASEITVPVVITGRLVGHLPARRAAAVGIAEATRRDRVLFMSPHYHITAGPGARRPEPQGGVVQPLAAGRQERRAEDAEGEPVPDQRHALGALHTRSRCRRRKYKRLYLSGAGLRLVAALAARRLAREQRAAGQRSRATPRRCCPPRARARG